MYKKLFSLFLVISWGLPCWSQSKELEVNLKAVFIYNFTKYVDWEADTAKNFVIGVLGRSAITDALMDIAATNTVNGKKILVRAFTELEYINQCNILFIPENTPYSIESIVNHTGKGVLTIGDHKDFAVHGTALNFVLKNDKLRFEANLKAISQSGLKVSSQLLKLAIITDN